MQLGSKSINYQTDIYLSMKQLIIIVSPEQIKKNRLSLPLWDTPIHIPGVCKCSQFSETNQSKPSSSYYEQSISISLGTKWIQVLFIPVVHLDFFQCFVIINNTGIGILVHTSLYH